jgi:hypothetical protein
MPRQLDETRGVDPVAEGAAEDSGERWDVGLGERLAQTIWRWLGRESVRLPEGPRDPEPVSLRKAA